MIDEYETEGFLLEGVPLEGDEDDAETLADAEAEDLEVEDEDEVAEIPAFEEEEE